jgi:hypothetical protein
MQQQQFIDNNRDGIDDRMQIDRNMNGIDDRLEATSAQAVALGSAVPTSPFATGQTFVQQQPTPIVAPAAGVTHAVAAIQPVQPSVTQAAAAGIVAGAAAATLVAGGAPPSFPRVRPLNI